MKEKRASSLKEERMRRRAVERGRKGGGGGGSGFGLDLPSAKDVTDWICWYPFPGKDIEC